MSKQGAVLQLLLLQTDANLQIARDPKATNLLNAELSIAEAQHAGERLRLMKVF